MEDFHAINLSPFEYDPLKVDPGKVANADQDMAGNIEITKHTGSSNRRANMTFYVKCSNRDETWKPWNNVRRTEAFHKYLIDNNTKHLIP